MGAEGKQRAVDRIAELSGRGLDVLMFWREANEIIRSGVPHHMTPCWFTLDPASLLMTSHFQADMDGMLSLLPAKVSAEEFMDELLHYEYYSDDVNKLADIARSERGIQTLHEATGGNPSASPRWQANMALGGDQELIAALRTGDGVIWGAVGIYREPGQPIYDPDELAFIGAVAPHLAHGARMGLLIGEATDPEWPDSPGLVVVSERGEVESASPGVERWLADLPDGDWDAGSLPTAVRSVAARALRTAAGPDYPGEVAMARVLAESGNWVVLHGTSLVAGGSRRAAVIVEGAHPARITPILMSAYGLTGREQEVTRRVLGGDSTAEIAAALVVSPHTVQQHLKSIFEKTGVRSRRDLVGKVFFSHYEPRVMDNEERVAGEQPLRGGPAPWPAP